MGSQRVRQDLATELMCWCVSLGSSSPEFCALPGPAYHVQFFAILWTGALQAHLSMELSRQESWRRLPFPTPGHPPNQGIELTSPELLHWQAAWISVSFPRLGKFLSLFLLVIFLALSLCLVSFWSPHKADVISLDVVPEALWGVFTC